MSPRPPIGPIAIPPMVLAVLACMPAEAPAQDRAWSVQGPRAGLTRSAAICPVEDGVVGNFFCVALACDEGPPGWEIALAGVGARPPEARTTWTIPGHGSFAMDMTLAEPMTYVAYRAPYLPEAQAELMAALRAGSAVTIAFDTPGIDAQTVPLRGSARALSAALEACPAPLAPVIADPPAHVLAQIAKDRGAAVDRLSPRPGFVSEIEVNADGVPDLVLDWGAVEAPDGFMSFYCGSAGCLTELYVSVPGGWRRAFGDNVYGVIPAQVLEIPTHGSFCGRVGAAGCTFYYRVNDDGSLTEIGQQ